MIAATMCLGVAIILVSLLDLGSDQVLKACKFEGSNEVYYLGECCREDSDKFRRCFQSVHDEEQGNFNIFLSMSPQALPRASM